MSTKMPPSHPSAVSYTGALGQSSADKRIEILRLIGQSGSISQAAREAGVSYKAAWQAIDTLTNLAGVELVTRAVGGAGGGGASLSGAGVQLLAAAGQLELARNQVLARLQQDTPSWLNPLSVRTSMRNQLPAQVQSLQTRGNIVQVAMALVPGSAQATNKVQTLQMTSRITLESAELLALKPGLAVLVLCKATAVSVSRIAGKAASATKPLRTGNVLVGRATRVSRGESGDEVSIALEAGLLAVGLQLVGFAPPASGIRVGSRVQARVDEAAMVVALVG